MALARCLTALRSLALSRLAKASSSSSPSASPFALPRAHALLATLLLSASASLASSPSPSTSPFSGVHPSAATACDSDSALLAAMSLPPSDPESKQSASSDPSASSPAETSSAPASAIVKLPSVFLNHGGGPSFFMSAEPGDFMYGLHDKSKYGDYLRAFANKELGDTRPKAIVVFSAHWETSGAIHINTRDRHSLYYDYGGFPAYTYQLKYPARGDPALGRRIASLLQSAGLRTQEDRERGLDHGVFVPLKLMFPEAEVPVVQVSLLDSLDPAAHLRIGAALEPLRSEGVLIFGSGALTHGFGAKPAQAQAFAKWARQAACSHELSAEQRFAQFKSVSKAPSFRHAHPSSEHLVPLFVAAGAGGLRPGKPVYQEAVAEGLFDLTGFRFD